MLLDNNIISLISCDMRDSNVMLQFAFVTTLRDPSGRFLLRVLVLCKETMPLYENVTENNLKTVVYVCVVSCHRQNGNWVGLYVTEVIVPVLLLHLNRLHFGLCIWNGNGAWAFLNPEGIMLLKRKSMRVSEQLSHKIVDSFYAEIFQKDRIIFQYSLSYALSLIDLCENTLRVRAKGICYVVYLPIVFKRFQYPSFCKWHWAT